MIREQGDQCFSGRSMVSSVWQLGFSYGIRLARRLRVLARFIEISSVEGWHEGSTTGSQPAPTLVAEDLVHPDFCESSTLGIPAIALRSLFRDPHRSLIETFNKIPYGGPQGRQRPLFSALWPESHAGVRAQVWDSGVSLGFKDFWACRTSRLGGYGGYLVVIHTILAGTWAP